ALRVGGGDLRAFNDRGQYWLVEWTTADGERHTSAIAKGDLTVISSGICLSGRDRDFDLQSLVGVIKGRDWEGAILDIFDHARLRRTGGVMAGLRDLPVTIGGGGALGANLTETLARQGFARLTVIDRDRVEERNLSTQPYFRGDIGAQKAKILANALYRALGVAVTGRAEELTAANAAKLL